MKQFVEEQNRGLLVRLTDVAVYGCCNTELQFLVGRGGVCGVAGRYRNGNFASEPCLSELASQSRTLHAFEQRSADLALEYLAKRDPALWAAFGEGPFFVQVRLGSQTIMWPSPVRFEIESRDTVSVWKK
jgi:hypothetical protein